MSTPPPSLLLVLAWDAHDPALRRGGAVPVPTLPLLRALAAQRPLLAVLPQLPGGGRLADLTAPNEALEPAENPQEPSEITAAQQPEAPAETATPVVRPIAEPTPAPIIATAAATAPAFSIALTAPELPTPVPHRPGRWPVPAAPFASRLLGVVEAMAAEYPGEAAAQAPAAADVPVAPPQQPGANATGAAALPKQSAVRPALTLRVPLAQRASQWKAPAAPYQGSAAATVLPEGFPAQCTTKRCLVSRCDDAGSGQLARDQAPLGGTGDTAPTTLPTGLPAPYGLAGQGQPAGPAAAASAEAVPAMVAAEAGAEEEVELLPLGGADAFARAETGPAEAADLSAETPEDAGPAAFDALASDALALLPETEPTAKIPAEAAAQTSANPAEAPAAPPAMTQVPAAAHATLAQGLATLRRPDTTDTTDTTTPPAPFALADDLHYRLIQYARFTVPLVAAQAEPFGLVYAADWPTWLAALELRYRCRCPLVLHLPALAHDPAAPAACGWLLELERYALRRAHTVLVATEGLRQQVLAAYPALLPERVAVCNVADAPALAAALAAVVPK